MRGHNCVDTLKMFFHCLKASGSFVAQLAFEECVFEPPIKTPFVFIRHFILLPGHCQSHTKLESFLAFRLEHEQRRVWGFSLGPCELGTPISKILESCPGKLHPPTLTQGVGGLLLEPPWEHVRGLKLKFTFQLLIRATKYVK